MVKFYIVDFGCRKQDIKYLIKELRESNLILASEMDEHGDTIYHTRNIAGVRRTAGEYDGIMVEIIK